MALSSWDTLAFGPDGKSCSGSHEFGKTKVEIYKNWIYVSNPEMWSGGSFSEPTIAQINSGHVMLGGVNFRVARHDRQDAVFVLATSGYGDEASSICGIGCYGYLGVLESLERFYPDEYRKIQGEYLDESKYELISYGSSSGAPTVMILDFWQIQSEEIVEVKIETGIEHFSPSKYVGVAPETAAAFLEWLAGEDDDYASKIKTECEKNPPLRYNQGDAYFDAHLGCGMDATPVGDAGDTVMSRALKADVME